MLFQTGFRSIAGYYIFRLLILTTYCNALNLPWPLRSLESKYLVTKQNDRVFENEGPWRDSTEQIPVRVRKMSDDEGEMFLPEFWGFEAIEKNGFKESLDQSQAGKELIERDEAKSLSNASMSQPLQAPFALHIGPDLDSPPTEGRFISPRHISPLEARAFSCPGDTTACTSIDRPNSCCPNGSACQSIPDMGSGDVGCCTQGQTCGGDVAGCPNGDTSCPGNAGGGCCVPGYVCAGVGCVLSSTAITTVQPVVTASPPSPPPPSITPQTTIPPVIPSSATIASTSTFTAITSVISTATSSRTPSPSSSSRSSTSPTAILPIRPTSSNANPIPTRTTTAAPVTITASTCPTGFYQCSAYNHQGCCRVGRDCGLTSCPAASSTLALSSNGVSVNVIPSASGSDGGGAGGCAGGWFSCAQGDGGGCCPSGYACGTSCTATGVVVQGGATGTAVVAKNNRGGKVEVAVKWWGLLVGSVGLMLLHL